jgi:hypothetical protein
MRPVFLAGFAPAPVMAFVIAVVIALLIAWPPARAADDPASLRAELNALRAAYEARLQALEARIAAAERALPAAPAAAAAPPSSLPSPSIAATPPSTPAPTTPATTPATAAQPPTGAANASAASAFNPALSLILSGLYTRTSRDPANFAISGFQLPAGGEAGPGTRGFSLAETELGIAASIDPWWRGAANISLAPDDTVAVEEAFVQTTALGSGLTLKAGRFFSGIGYLNPQHAHTWDFVDAPLAYQALLGGQLGDDGVQLNWLAPTDRYVEVGVELGRGRGFPGSDTSRNGAGRVSLALHTGGDIGDSHNWRAGVSFIRAKADDQDLVGLDASGSAIHSLFNGRTRVTMLDAVWKWAPDGNATRTNFKLQAEWLRSARDGTLVYDPSGANLVGDLRTVQSGAYVQAVYQFVPRWRVGLRTEQLDPGSPTFSAGSSLLDANGYRPRKHTLMVDYSASEFSRLRLQLARDQSRFGITDNQLMLQYQMSLGAHGAHGY